MKKIITLIFVALAYSLNAQTIDYNTKKGFVANGYDVVAYFSNSATKGDNKYVATYDAVKYKFASKENLETFNNNPKKYIPQYGGYCAYAIAVKSKKVAINPETFEIRDDKLYLFYNSWIRNTLDLWLEEGPENLQQKGNKNWAHLKNKKE